MEMWGDIDIKDDKSDADNDKEEETDNGCCLETLFFLDQLHCELLHNH